MNQRYKRYKDRWKRYEKPQPGHRIQVDVKFLERMKDKRQRYYQFTAIDDCTRLRVLRIYEKNNQLTAVQITYYPVYHSELKSFRRIMVQSFEHNSIGICWI